MSETAACDHCADLHSMQSAYGPDGVLERVRMMLDLTRHGFTEQPHPSSGRWQTIEWSEIGRDAITARMIQNGWQEQRWRGVDSSMAISCDRCGRVYQQSWAFDKGGARWWIAEPGGELRMVW